MRPILCWSLACFALGCAGVEEVLPRDGGARDLAGWPEDDATLIPVEGLDRSINIEPGRPDIAPDEALPQDVGLHDPDAGVGLDAASVQDIGSSDPDAGALDLSMEPDAAFDATILPDMDIPMPPYGGLTERMTIEMRPPGEHRWYPFFNLDCPYNGANVEPWPTPLGQEGLRRCAIEWHGLVDHGAGGAPAGGRYESVRLLSLLPQDGAADRPMQIELRPQGGWGTSAGRQCMPERGQPECSMYVFQLEAGSRASTVVQVGNGQSLSWQLVDIDEAMFTDLSVHLFVSIYPARALRQGDAVMPKMCLIPTRADDGTSTVEMQRRVGFGSRIRSFMAAAVQDDRCLSQLDRDRWGEGRFWPVVPPDQRWEIRTGYQNPMSGR